MLRDASTLEDAHRHSLTHDNIASHLQVSAEDGVESVDVSLDDKLATIVHDPSLVSPDKLAEVIEGCGFDATLQGLFVTVGMGGGLCVRGGEEPVLISFDRILWDGAGCVGRVLARC